MPRASGLMNPENAVKGGGAFKEGFIRIDSNSYKVHQSKPGEGEAPIPATKWAWQVTRLAEDGSEPLTDEHGDTIHEELLFSFGGKCLPFVHPGQADSADDEDPDDQGTVVATENTPASEGNTIYLNAADWKPNEKSGLMVLTKSMIAAGIKPEFLNRCWCPDWVGCVFEMKTQGATGADGKTFNYKIVSKVLVGPGKKGIAAAGKAASNGAGDAESFLAPVLTKLSEELDGTQLTRKAFLNRVRAALDAAKVDSKLLVPVLSLCKDDKWLAAHAETFDYTLDPATNTIAFGTVPV